MKEEKSKAENELNDEIEKMEIGDYKCKNCNTSIQDWQEPFCI